MKHILLLLSFILLCQAAHAQKTDTWIAFYNKGNTLTGFKNAKGKVMIPPRFTNFTVATRFDHIMAAAEENNGRWKNYYLTKEGKMVAQDSLYVADNTPDCENEGFIRFHDYTTGETGILNRDGHVAIPAGYNDMTQVRNGMIIALKDATKDMEKGGEHFRWTGGKELLIDTLNHVLADSFPLNNDLDFYSLKILAQPDTDTTRENFRGTNGMYLSFTNYRKEFSAWWRTLLQKECSPAALAQLAGEDIFIWRENEGWVKEPRSVFIARNAGLIQQKIKQLGNSTAYQLFSNQACFMIDELPRYKQYTDNCDHLKYWQYPVMEIVVDYTFGSTPVQDSFSFIRTEKGYKLVCVTIRDKELK